MQQADKKKTAKSAKKTLLGGSVKGSSALAQADDDYNDYNDDDFM